MRGCTLPWTIILHEPSAPSSCMQPWWGKSWWFLFSKWCRSQGEAQTCSPAAFPWTPWVWQPLGPCCSTLLPLQWLPLAAERSLSWTNELYTSILFCRRAYTWFWGTTPGKAWAFQLQCFIKSFFTMFFPQGVQPSRKRIFTDYHNSHTSWATALLLFRSKSQAEEEHYHFSPSLVKTFRRLHISGSQRDYLADRAFHLFPLCHLQM